MEKLLPGFHLLPRWARRFAGWGVLALGALLIVAPMIVVAGSGPICGGGYPDKWCKRSLDSVVDNWGMYNRECVSYTAYRVAASGRKMPYGFGDANNWPVAARFHGIAVDSVPRAGDVAIRYDDKHGHSMYVESINPDGSLRISQYNVNKVGTFSQDTVRPDGLEFIHF